MGVDVSPNTAGSIVCVAEFLCLRVWGLAQRLKDFAIVP